MPNYMISGQYSPGSWARMMRAADNRTDVVSKLMQSVGGSLTKLYWQVNGHGVHAIVELPDSASAAAVNTVLAQSGAFKTSEISEVLDQDQLSGVLRIADNIAKEYQVPGAGLLHSDLSHSHQ
jgi:uncharacterized protein with GYD domain